MTLLSSSVRPSIKFLMLENFERIPKQVKLGIVSAVLKAEPTRHTEIIKEELKYIITQERIVREGHDINGRPAPDMVAGIQRTTVAEQIPQDFPKSCKKISQQARTTQKIIYMIKN